MLGAISASSPTLSSASASPRFTKLLVEPARVRVASCHFPEKAKPPLGNGGSDGTRTRGLLRDRQAL